MALEPVCVNEADWNTFNFMCMICHGVMKNPFLATCCKKSYCEFCINEHRKRNSHCPNCKAKIKSSTLFLNRDLRDVIDSQPVYCYFKSEGCKWTGKRGNFEKHLKKSCDFYRIKCEYGCGQEYLRKEKKSHFTSNFSCVASMEKRLKELTQSSEDRIEELGRSAEFQVQAFERQRHMLQGEKQQLVREKQELVREKQELKRELQIVIEQRKIDSIFCIGLIAVCVCIFGKMYFHYDACPLAKPEPLQENNVPLMKTEIAKFVALKSTNSSFSWQVNINKYWEFELFAAQVDKINGTYIYMTYEARRIPAANVNFFKASVIVQIFNPDGTDHHVSRMDVVFEAKTADKSWYTTGSFKLMDLIGSNRKFYPGPDSSLKLRIVNVEVGTNNIWPYHFSMCHFKHYQVHSDLEWNTYPFYIGDYKFMIYIHANGYGASKGKALTLTAYRIVGEKDDILLEKMKSRTIFVKIKKKDGDYERKRLAITGRATVIVEDGIEVDFQGNSRFPRYGYRSKYGTSLDIPHSELDKYVDEDCLIFGIYLADT